MKCPNCGYKRQKRDDAFVPATECPSCGIVYSKHEGIPVPGLPISGTSAPPPIRPSAVDPESLKKAKERVEKRLRGRLEAPVRDERHAQTLELAKKLTGTALRNRKDDPAVKKETDKAADKGPDQVVEQNGAESDDPLLLEDAIGVQLYNGQRDVAPKTSEDDTPSLESTSDDEGETPFTETKPDDEGHAPSSETMTDGEDDAPELETMPDDEGDASEDTLAAPEQALLDEQADSDDTSAYPEDVQVETVLLSSDEHVETETAAPIMPEDTITLEESTDSEATDLPPAYIAAASTMPKTQASGLNLKRLLPIIAWLILFSGVIGAVLSWTTITDVEAGVKMPGANASNALPVGLLLGFAYLATGALGFAFFWVSSMISRQLKDIRKLLMVHPIAMYTEETAADQPKRYSE